VLSLGKAGFGEPIRVFLPSKYVLPASVNKAIIPAVWHALGSRQMPDAKNWRVFWSIWRRRLRFW
jgi:hypothetical protein